VIVRRFGSIMWIDSADLGDYAWSVGDRVDVWIDDW